MAKGKSSPQATAQKDPLFYSYDGTERTIDLPDGRTAIVGEKPRALPPAFWRAALKNGCGSTSQPPPEAMRLPDQPAEADAFRRRTIIERAIADALSQDTDSTDEAFAGSVTIDGQINMQWLNKHVGFTVERSERDEAYRKVVAEAEAEDEAGGQTADELDEQAARSRSDED